MGKNNKHEGELLAEIDYLKNRIKELEISETRRQLAERALRETESNYHELVQLLPDAILIHDSEKIIFINNSCLKFFGAKFQEEIIGKPLINFIHPDYHKIARERERWVLERGLEIPFILEKFKKIDGSEKYGEGGGIPFSFNGKRCVLRVIRDVSERLEMEKELLKSEKKYRLLVQNASEAIIVAQEGMIKFVNPKGEEILQRSAIDLQSKPFTEFIHPEDRDMVLQRHIRRTSGTDENMPNEYEFRIIDGKGNTKWVAIKVVKAEWEGSPATLNLLIDITDQKKALENIAYITNHDSLTGIENLISFQQKLLKTRPPAGIILIDIDGLRYINETLGRESGDRVIVAISNILQSNLRRNDILARTGEDEFGIILTIGNQEKVDKISTRIKKAIENKLESELKTTVTVSVAYSCSSNPADSSEKIMSDAISTMRRLKLLKSRGAGKLIMESFTKILREKKLFSDEDATLMQKLATSFGQYAGLPQQTVEEITLLSKFHSLGMIAIPMEILFKTEKLNDREMELIKKHCEIGKEIASTIEELKPIADLILKHHERWDGSGYPMGLRGESIPLECRIIAIVEAYCALRKERPYRNAMTHKEAIEEILRGSEKQFDPKLVPIFTKIFEQHPEWV